MFPNHLRLLRGMSKVMFSASSNLLLCHFSKANSKFWARITVIPFHCGFVNWSKCGTQSRHAAQTANCCFLSVQHREGMKTSKQLQKKRKQ